MKTLHFSVSEEFRSLLDANSVTKTFPAGASVFKRGDPVQGVYLIRKGEISLSLADVPELAPRVVGAGALVGLPATMSGAPYSLAAEAVEPVEAGFIPHEDFVQLLKENPGFSLTVIQGLASELGEARRQASQLLEERFQGALARET